MIDAERENFTDVSRSDSVQHVDFHRGTWRDNKAFGYLLSR